MSQIDWVVLIGTLATIVGYGVWKTRKNANLNEYLKGGKDLGWATIGLSVMATQASAITFISTPGQAYESGMAFVQNYFGLPLALIVVCAVFIPIYYKLKVYTAYEYLEQRFDLKVRLLTAFLFLVQRGLAAGITIYAPAIILAAMLGWDLNLTIIGVGALVIIYTVTGGTRAVSLTQKWQMMIILTGMFTAFFLLLQSLPESFGFTDALHVAGKSGRLEIVDFSFDLKKRYTIWTGIGGGFFLALSYFGTDQSQVQRYLGGKSVNESRMGLIFNALLKIPMQFFILLTGVLVFVFYQLNDQPLLFNRNAVSAVQQSEYAEEFSQLNHQHHLLHDQKKETIHHLVQAIHEEDQDQTDIYQNQLQVMDKESKALRDQAQELAFQADPTTVSKDSDYVFLTYILDHLPKGIVGLLIAVILSAAMSSTSGELNALASTTTIDFYKRLGKVQSAKQEVLASKWLTLFWGILAISFALFARLVENLIEAVNILGSLFYGTVLGVFLIAFFLKKLKSFETFIGAIITQTLVIASFFILGDDVSYLLYNLLGCLSVLIFSYLVGLFRN
ncbi:sodium:solute symporter [bacterium SCSIO 12741]|nr:sodium:solute symporter [bacterium SCSIO 12741]